MLEVGGGSLASTRVSLMYPPVDGFKKCTGENGIGPLV